MGSDDRDPFETYKVVLNPEEQYSIWPTERPNPAGWRDEGKSGTRQECLDHIEQVWTDMRPLSLRRKMEELARNPPPPREEADLLPEGRTLVERLCDGDHPIEIRLRPESTALAVKRCIDRGYVQVFFPETQGGTELGLRLSPEVSDWSKGDFDAAHGWIRLVGQLTLDLVKVRCVANVDLATLKGQGRLERV